MTENRVMVSGRVTRIRRYPKGNAAVTIASKAGKIIEPVFTVKDGMWEKLRVRDRVEVIGHIETYISGKNDTKTKKQVFVADTIKKETTLTEAYFGIKGKFYGDMYAKAYIRGIVAGFTDSNDGWVHYIINVDGKNSRKYWIKVNQKKSEYTPIYKKGDEICAVCGITTCEKEKDGKTLKFEDLIVTDIAKVKEEKKKAEKPTAEMEPIF